MAFDEINSKWIDGQQRFNRHDVGILLGMLTDSFDLEEEIDDLRQQNAQLLEVAQRLVALKYEDGGRGYPSEEDIVVARAAIAAFRNQ